jgi:hypothetical protein
VIVSMGVEVGDPLMPPISCNCVVISAEPGVPSGFTKATVVVSTG